jgi:hypothetical protein
MPLGNIDPRNDTLTLTSMKLGNEEYPSTVQQAESENTGYLLYKPFFAASYNGSGTLNASGFDQTLVTLGYIYLSGGKYDSNLRMELDASSIYGTVWLEIGGVQASSKHILDTDGTTIDEKYSTITLTEGWSSVVMKSDANIGTEIYPGRLNAHLRQYE